MSIVTMQTYSPNKPKNMPLWQAVGLPANHGPNLIQALKKGLTIDVVDKITKELNISLTSLFEFTGIKALNYARRRKAGKLNSDESERIARYIRVVDTVSHFMCNDRKEALAWMNEPAKGLDGQAPNSFIHTETGALEVMQLIGRIRHGVFI